MELKALFKKIKYNLIGDEDIEDVIYWTLIAAFGAFVLGASFGVLLVRMGFSW